MRELLAACVLCCLAFPVAAAEGGAARSASELLRRMDDALTQQSYDGVFTYMRGDAVSSLRLMHTLINGVRYERLVHLDGTPREILRTGNRLLVVLQRGDELADLTDDIPVGPFARAFVRSYRRVPMQYRLALRGTGRIAGRAAQVVAIEPIDGERYAHQLWIDESTGMLLKSQLVAADGTPLEVFQCAQISLGRALSASDFAPPNDPNRSVHPVPAMVAARAQPRSAAWRIGWLPRGFAMAGQNSRSTRVNGQDLQALLFGDGLAAVSVFIEPLPNRLTLPDNKQIMREGATVAISIVARDRASRAHLLTVVGEVPTATAERVVRSITARR